MFASVLNKEVVGIQHYKHWLNPLGECISITGLDARNILFLQQAIRAVISR